MAAIRYQCSDCGHFFADTAALYRHPCFQSQTLQFAAPAPALRTHQNPGTKRPASATVSSATLSHQSHESAAQTQNIEIEEDCDDLSTVNNPIFWSHEAILLLVRTYQEYKDLFTSPVVKRQEVWKKISMKLLNEGHKYTPVACDKKFRSLKYRYNAIMDSNKQTGRGKRAWGYLDLMGEVLEGDPAVTPVATLASMPQDSQPKAVKRSIELPTRAQTQALTVEKPTLQSTSQVIAGEVTAKPISTPKKKAKKSVEMPEWFVAFAKKQESQLDDVKSIQMEALAVAKERNDILRAFTQALSRRNEV